MTRPVAPKSLPTARFDYEPHPPEWMASALCAQVGDPDMWYPTSGVGPAVAKALCRVCPSQAECLAHALEHHEAFGIWGGKSERQRRRMQGAA